ncbi:MAG: DNA-protecting protein DprA [Spirochaetaceae bacterium]|nr:MAG: DNA-protecting protein DprA [Spirochaetaceae bacterium]
MTPITPVFLAVHRITSLRCGEKEAVLTAVRTESGFSMLDKDRLSRVAGRGLKIRSFDPAALLRAGEQDLRICETRGIRILPVWSTGYPPLLRETFDPPFLLFVRGEIAPPDAPQCAVVGTRHPSEAARREARRFASDLAGHGIPVVSGLAAGIDGEAHRGAVDACGHTTAVLGSGIDTLYPASHRSLAGRMLESDGAIVSEYPPGTPPLKHHFPQRNRIISGLSRWVVLMEAPEHSGALITADYALDQGRELCVHSVGVSAGPAAAGTRALSDEGARIVAGASDLYEDPADSAYAEHAAGNRGGSVRPAHSRADIGTLLARSLQHELALTHNQGSTLHGN